MRNHLNPDAEGPYEAQKASNHPQVPPHAIGPHCREKTCLITALHRTFRDSMVSKHPPNSGVPAVKLRMAKSLARKGGRRERRLLSNKAHGGLSTTSRLAEFLRSGGGWSMDNPSKGREVIGVAVTTMGSDLLTQSCHSVMREDREWDEEVGGN